MVLGAEDAGCAAPGLGTTAALDGRAVSGGLEALMGGGLGAAMDGGGGGGGGMDEPGVDDGGPGVVGAGAAIDGGGGGGGGGRLPVLIGGSNSSLSSKGVAALPGGSCSTGELCDMGWETSALSGAVDGTAAVVCIK